MMSNLFRKLNSNLYKQINSFSRLTLPALNEQKDLLEKPSVFMALDRKHVICYHPEAVHPFEFTKSIERKIENDTPLSSDLMNLYLARHEGRIARNPNEHWSDALRLSKIFNEHPIVFKRPNRRERIKRFMEEKQPNKKNRESI